MKKVFKTKSTLDVVDKAIKFAVDHERCNHYGAFYWLVETDNDGELKITFSEDSDNITG